MTGTRNNLAARSRPRRGSGGPGGPWRFHLHSRLAAELVGTSVLEGRLAGNAAVERLQRASNKRVSARALMPPPPPIPTFKSWRVLRTASTASPAPTLPSVSTWAATSALPWCRGTDVTWRSVDDIIGTAASMRTDIWDGPAPVLGDMTLRGDLIVDAGLLGNGPVATGVGTARARAIGTDADMSAARADASADPAASPAARVAPWPVPAAPAAPTAPGGHVCARRVAGAEPGRVGRPLLPRLLPPRGDAVARPRSVSAPRVVSARPRARLVAHV